MLLLLVRYRYVHETDRVVQAHHSRRQPSQDDWPSLSPTGSSTPPPSDDTMLETSISPRVIQPVPAIAESSATFHTSPSSAPLPPETAPNLPPETPCGPSTRCWSFKDATEVLLFQHFTRCLSSFFDLCDPDHHFAIQIPVRARLYPPLMDAILALSARHMSLVGKEVDSILASHYYQRCLSILIPELDSVHHDCVDDLLAATIILRLHEELDGPFSGSKTTYRHSIGTRALLQTQASQVSSVSGLRRAAFWAGLRQEIYASIKRHRPPAIRASAEMLAHLGPLAMDSAWAESAVSHCLDVLDFCFGDESMNADLYDTLCERIMRWEAERPASYDPLCFEVRIDPNDETNSSWDVRYHGDWHGT
ncbi:hypothetical protein N7485_003095 [Penicillium canescens]|nr:hypothetical protein N7485_003095 [Penicillium canescens]